MMQVVVDEDLSKMDIRNSFLLEICLFLKEKKKSSDLEHIDFKVSLVHHKTMPHLKYFENFKQKAELNAS
jgi:hypothetical protein